MIFLNGGILLVEDDESLSRAVSLTLSNEGYKVYTAATAAGARAVFASAGAGDMRHRPAGRKRA